MVKLLEKLIAQILTGSLKVRAARQEQLIPLLRIINGSAAKICALSLKHYVVEKHFLSFVLYLHIMILFLLLLFRNRHSVRFGTPRSFHHKAGCHQNDFEAVFSKDKRYIMFLQDKGRKQKNI